MTSSESIALVSGYFARLFDQRDLSALDDYLSPRYFDDDIGETARDHVALAKEYLAALWLREPTIQVKIEGVLSHDEVVTVYLAWAATREGKLVVLRKGVATFVMNGGLIVRRHTFIYFPDSRSSSS